MSQADGHTRRRPPWGRRPTVLALAAAVAVIAVCGITVAARRGGATPWSPTTLQVLSAGELTTYDAYVGSTYNLGLTLQVDGAGTVELVSASLRHVDDGLALIDPIVAWGCDGNEYWGAVVAGDLTRLPRTDARPLRGTRVTAADRSCRYVLLRFVPQRKGTLAARDGEVVYRVGARTIRTTFEFATEFEVTEHGRDPRTKPGT